MATFGGIRPVFIPFSDQARFAEAGARRNQRPVAGSLRIALVKGDEMAGFEYGNAVRVRFQIVQQTSRSKTQALRHRPRVNVPGEVGSLDAPVFHRSGNAEGRRLYRLPMLGQKSLENLLEPPVNPAGIYLRNDGNRPLRAAFKQGKPGVGAADVTRQDHAD